MPLKTSGPARSFRGITDCPQQTRTPTPESSPALLRQLSHSSHSQILGTPLRPPRRGFSRPRPLVFRWVSAPWKKLHGCNKAGLLEHNGSQTEPITVTTKAGGRSVHTGRGGGVWGWWQGGWGKRGGWGGQPVGRLTDSLHFLLCWICCQVAAEEEDETQRTNCLRRLN